MDNNTSSIKNSISETGAVKGSRITGIFCRPSCNAGESKGTSSVTFSSATEAVMYGYRPCKLCSPMELNSGFPDEMKAFMDKTTENPNLVFRDRDIRAMGADPEKAAYWFNKYHGITFHTYLRALRIGRAFGRVCYGETGTEEFSGVNPGCDKKAAAIYQVKGQSVRSKEMERQTVFITRIRTPLGPMLAGAVKEGLCLLEFVDRRMIETQLKRLSRLINADYAVGESIFFSQISSELEAYFEGRLKTFTVSLVLPGTDFQKKVWAELQRIPYGSTRSYSEQAGAIGRQKAVRAVAGANGDNRMAIVVPCHRVIGADGALTGYGGKLWRKKYLLDLERRIQNGPEVS